MTSGGDIDLEQLRKDVQELKDIEAIKQLRARYFECVDAQDWDGWANDVLTEDFHFDSEAGVQDGRDAVIAVISKSLTGGKTVHHGHQQRITVTGDDTASGVWRMSDYVTIPMPDGSEFVMRGYGYYFDDYVRTPQGWRLKSSRMERLRVDVEGEFVIPANAAGGD